MDTDSDSSPSPLRAGTLERDPKRLRKSSSSGHLGRSSMELLKLLVLEQREVQDLRAMLQDMTLRSHDETRRADSAERAARETVQRFKEANEMRLAAQQELNRTKEELRIYKMQLETAQREILKGQELLDRVEGERHEAEEAAARARTTARKFKEEKIVLVARQEGREEGIKEGIERGRMLGFEDGRTEGYERGWAAAEKHFAKRRGDVSVHAKTPLASTEDSPLPPEPDPVIRVHPPLEYEPAPAQIPSPAPMQRPVPISPCAPSPVPALDPIPVFLKEAPHTPSPPRSIHSAQSVRDYLPDGWIPVVDKDQRIRLPPPHELAPAPPTPELTPITTPKDSPPVVARQPPVPAETPPLMIPPPRPPSDAVSETDSASIRSGNRRSRTGRRASGDSQSTTISQFDLIQGPSARAGSRPNVLSAIAEEKERSPSVASSMRRPLVSPAIPIPGGIYSPQVSVPGGNGVPPVQDPKYLSPNPFPGLSRRGSASTVGYHDIVVQPPSRPESWNSAAFDETGGLLSPRDAEHPLPPAPFSGPPTPAAELSKVTQGLPPGFVPNNSAPTPSAGGYTGATAAGVPLPPSTAPSTFNLHGPEQHTQPTPVIPLPRSMTDRRYSRAAVRQDSSSSSDDNSPSASRTSSSMSSLTTPPQRRKILSIYGAAPSATNPAGSDTGYTYAARVPLPTSNADSSSSAATPARIPLPPSSAGSPRSVFTRMSRPGTSAP